MTYRLLLLALLPFMAAAQNYPVTKKTPATVTKFGASYQDDYTWLEDMDSPGVKKWADAQNDLTAASIRKVGTAYDIENRIYEYEKSRMNPLPKKMGDYFYATFRQKQLAASLYYFTTIDGQPKLLVDMSRYDESARITGYAPSANSQLLAYTISEDGSDREKLRFMDIESGKPLNDVLQNVKFTNLEWNGQKGIFYKRNTNTNRFAADSTYQLYYHAIGNRQDQDLLVFDAMAHKTNFSYTVNDGKLFITGSDPETQKPALYYADLDKEPFAPVNILEDETDGFRFINYHGGRIYYATQASEWGEVRSCSLSGRGDEKTVIPQFYGQLLVQADFLDKYIVCKYKTLDKYHFNVYDADVNFIKKFDVTPGTDATPVFYDSASQKIFLTLQSYTATPQNFTLDLKTGDFEPYYNWYFKPKATLFPLDYFETKAITYKSRDGKDVPLTLVYKKGIQLNGNNPTLLYAYGGFGVVEDPSYNPALLYFLEHGGVYAYAAIRGGGEKGLKWQQNGKGANKINGLNDFIDAAEYLISQKYTSPDRLGIMGGSHGGLVVGHAMVFRPDLFKVVICRVGVLDAIKRNEYGTGLHNMGEYGDITTAEGYKDVLAYSPYQNIKDNVNYPAALIITAENDDRVPPMHSYKFAARLQNCTAQTHPVLLRILQDAGHHVQLSKDDRIANEAEVYSFLMYELGR